MNALRVFFAELAAIVKDRKTMIQMIGVMAIPVLYCGVFLYAFWDPYGHVDELPVAIVNQDQGAVLSGEKLNIGKNLTDDLKKNRGFDWHFVSQQQAEKGLEENHYYMLITIPKNFSKDATTIQDKQTNELSLSYKVNRDYNYVASKMGESGAKEVKNKVSTAITETYAKTMYQKLDDLSGGLKEASNGAGELADGSDKEHQGLLQLKKHFADLSNSSVTLTNGSNELAQGSDKLENGLTDLTKGTNHLYNQTKSKTDDIQKLTAGANTLAGKMDEMSKAVNQLAQSDAKLVSGAEDIQANLETAMDGVKQQIKDYQGFEQKLNDVAPLLEDVSHNTDKLEEDMDKATAFLNRVDSKEPELSSAVQQYVDKHPEVKQDADFKRILASTTEMDQLHSQAQQVKSQLGDPKDLAPKIKELSQKMNQFSNVKGKVLTEFNDLESAENRLVSGMQQLQAQLNKLPEATSQLSDGADKLASGTDALNKSWPTLVSGVKHLNDGGNELLVGSENLNNNVTKLAGGMSGLANGAEKMGNGISDLEKDAGKLDSGNKQLAGKLDDAHKKVAETPTDDDHAKMFAQPIHLTDATHANVNNYGSGFTPYFLSLGLFVGALMLTVIYELRESRLKPRSGASLALGKYLVMAVMGICQALIADVVIMFGLGLSVDNPLLFILFSILTSLTFMAIIQFFTSALGNPGRFVVILILILQLTTSGGTYPIELIPSPLHSIPQWLPMTYSIEGFKNIIAGNQWGMLSTNAMILGIFLVVAVACTILFHIFSFKKHRNNEEEGQKIAG